MTFGNYIIFILTNTHENQNYVNRVARGSNFSTLTTHVEIHMCLISRRISQNFLNEFPWKHVCVFFFAIFCYCSDFHLIQTALTRAHRVSDHGNIWCIGFRTNELSHIPLSFPKRNSERIFLNFSLSSVGCTHIFIILTSFNEIQRSSERVARGSHLGCPSQPSKSTWITWGRISQNSLDEYPLKH